MSEKTVVTVSIAGEEYTLRTEATAEYTQRCASYVNDAIEEILRQGSLVQVQKVAILASLALADQLFQARQANEDLRGRIARLAGGLSADIEARLGAQELASPR